MGLYEDRLARIRNAIALKPVDKIPVVSGAAAWSAAACGVTLADFCNDMELNCSCSIKTTEMMGSIDAIQTALSSAEPLPTLWLSNIRVPGKELPNNELWQVVEKELMTQEDYDEILKTGFGPWLTKYMVERLDDPIKRMAPITEYGPIAAKRWREAEYPVIKNMSLLTPFEMVCGGRSLVSFLCDDLIEIPEKLDEVFAEIHRYNMDRYEKRFASDAKPLGAWIGGWRGTPETLSPAMFERFSWKYYRDLVNLCIKYDVIPIMHLDASWTNGLTYFNEFPAGKCIMALDGKTDIYKAKEIVGDKVCIMGDVRSELLAFGTPKEVYDYCYRLCTEIGPTGFILSSGCDIPFNAKLENVQMMGKAAEDASRA